jgi:carboxyl-terminal processing protease
MPARFSPTLLAVLLIPGCFLLLGSSCFADEAPVPQPPAELYGKFVEVYARIRAEYVDEVDDEKLFNDAIKGMVAGLDPYSSYLDYEGMKENGVPNRGPFGGLGIEVAMEDGLVKVVSPIEDTPAYRAGIRPSDLITQIDDTPVKGMTLADAIKRMRGEPDSTVRLAVTRKTAQKPLEFSLVRAVINNPSVKFRIADPGYPYLRITQFREHTGEELAAALVALREQNGGPLKGLVLDLRDNPGGSLAAAVAVASAFLQRDALVVYSEGRTPDARARLFANPDNYVEGGADNDYLKDIPPETRTVPLVVLVNGGSASAAEIVSGALQDHHRARILGTQTFGKGTIQTLLPLSTGSAVKLTVARYFTPNGRSLQAKGITPDLVVEQPESESANQPAFYPASRNDRQYQQALRVLGAAQVAKTAQ